MDVVSHAAWGYALLHGRGRSWAWAGAAAGAAPDLLFFIPSRVEQIIGKGTLALTLGSEPGIWRSDGPPLPPELVEAYSRYYTKTHSLVILALACLLVLILKRRSYLWLALPYAFHILLDIPTHERYLTPFLYPIREWTVQGLSWTDPRIFFPNLAGLIGVHIWLIRKGWPATPDPAIRPTSSASEQEGTEQ